MAELDIANAGECCPPAERESCCEPEAKEACCGPERDAGTCGCGAGAAKDDGAAPAIARARPAA